MPTLLVISVPIGIAAAVIMGTVVAVCIGPLLRRFPEPVDPSAEGKILYRELATIPTAVLSGGLVAAAAVVVFAWAPVACWPVYVALILFGVPIAVIDDQATWIPRPLSHASWVGLLVAAVVIAASQGWAALGWMSLGALIATLVLGVTWWFQDLGFGDVRLAPLVGAAAGSLGLEWVLVALLGGTALGAVHMLVRHLTGRGKPHPLAPALVAGAVLVIPLSQLPTG